MAIHSGLLRAEHRRRRRDRRPDRRRRLGGAHGRDRGGRGDGVRPGVDRRRDDDGVRAGRGGRPRRHPRPPGPGRRGLRAQPAKPRHQCARARARVDRRPVGHGAHRRGGAGPGHLAADRGHRLRRPPARAVGTSCTSWPDGPARPAGAAASTGREAPRGPLAPAVGEAATESSGSAIPRAPVSPAPARSACSRLCPERGATLPGSARDRAATVFENSTACAPRSGLRPFRCASQVRPTVGQHLVLPGPW